MSGTYRNTGATVVNLKERLSSMRNDPLASKTAKQIFEDCVWISDEPTAVKIFLLCVGRFFDHDCRASSMSYAQIARECGLSERYAKTVAARVRGVWLQIEVGKGWYVPGQGNQNLYHGTAPQELVDRLRSELLSNGNLVEEKKAAGVLSDHPAGVHTDHPASTGVLSDHPEKGGRGDLHDIPGCSEITRTAITAISEVKKDSDTSYLAQDVQSDIEDLIQARVTEAVKAAVPAKKARASKPKSDNRPYPAVRNPELLQAISDMAREVQADKGGAASGWTDQYVRDRLQCFDSFYKNNRKIVDNDWVERARRWLLDTRHAPRASFVNRRDPASVNTDEVVNNLKNRTEEDW